MSKKDLVARRKKKVAKRASDFFVPEWGDVLVAEFPFSDHGNVKRRPAVFLGYGHKHEAVHNWDHIIIAITSRLDATLPGAYIDDWERAGLLKPCAFKPNIMTVEPSFIVKKAGSLSERDQSKLKKLINYWILEE
ncbi:MAG: hypothetical protein ACN2B6_06180 [Rickettsiales bacterium]